MKYYIIAGEASGDLHGSNLIKGLISADPNASFRFWGGDLMAAASGCDPVRHYRETAIMGFVEVVTHLKKISANFKLCRADLINYNPDVLILIDYPGFNFRMAEFAKKRGIRVFYYIAPKVWAWKEKRVHKLQKFVDKLFIIFPFEKSYFKGWNIDAIYNGNPLIDSIDSDASQQESRSHFFERHSMEDVEYIALLAGSRKGEIEYLLPRMVKLERLMEGTKFILAAAPSMDISFYDKFLKESSIKVIKGDTYAVLRHAGCAVISSGTASLEAALLETPQVVCYGGNEITYQIAKRFVKVKYISLVNLILDTPLVKELIQHDCTPQKIAAELKRIRTTKETTKIREKYHKLKEILGGEGASLKVANSMVEELKKMIDDIRYIYFLNTPLGYLKIVCNDTYLLEISHAENSAENSCNPEDMADNSPMVRTIKQLQEYFTEERKEFDLPLRLNGTDFQKSVWEELCKIPYGKSKTYSEIAELTGNRDAQRAVGMACKMNPISIVVPCHRVLGAHNKLTGFNMGIDKKSYLLNLEKTYIHTDNNIFSNED